jgi:hypothetical protein
MVPVNEWRIPTLMVSPPPLLHPAGKRGSRAASGNARRAAARLSQRRQEHPEAMAGEPTGVMFFKRVLLSVCAV